MKSLRILITGMCLFFLSVGGTRAAEDDSLFGIGTRPISKSLKPEKPGLAKQKAEIEEIVDQQSLTERASRLDDLLSRFIREATTPVYRGKGGEKYAPTVRGEIIALKEEQARIAKQRASVEKAPEELDSWIARRRREIIGKHDPEKLPPRKRALLVAEFSRYLKEKARAESAKKESQGLIEKVEAAVLEREGMMEIWRMRVSDSATLPPLEAGLEVSGIEDLLDEQVHDPSSTEIDIREVGDFDKVNAAIESIETKLKRSDGSKKEVSKNDENRSDSK